MLQCILVLGMLTVNDLFYLIELIGFGYSCIMMSVIAALIYMRFKLPDLPRGIKVGLILHFSGLQI